jgi:hypothetical protein
MNQLEISFLELMIDNQTDVYCISHMMQKPIRMIEYNIADILLKKQIYNSKYNYIIDVFYLQYL